MSNQSTNHEHSQRTQLKNTDLYLIKNLNLRKSKEKIDCLKMI